MTAPPPEFRGAFRTDLDARAAYATAAGIGRAIPAAVARPEDSESVAPLIRWAAAEGLTIVPRGSGSSMAGGAIGHGLVLDLGALTAIGVVDTAHRRVRAAAGAIRDDVDRTARAAGLRFPVDPSSGAFCSIGGMVGTNAAGARSLAFGAMRGSVLALDCVFADGSRAEVRRGVAWQDVPALRGLAQAVPRLRELALSGTLTHAGVRKESSGYAVAQFLGTEDVVDLLVGAEGSLCVVLAAELALLPLPAATSSVLSAFPSLEDAVHAAAQAAGLGATACELLDRTFLDVARSGGHAHGIPADAEAVLLTEVEGADGDAARARADTIAAAFRAAGASVAVTAVEPVAEAELWEVRHAASPTIARLHPELRSMQFIEDGAVPPARFADYVRGVRAALARHGLRGVIFGHAGDAHAHVNPLVDVAADGWDATVRSLLHEVTALVASLGGTIAAEHGDGRVRTPLLPVVWAPEALEAFDIVKRSLDPAGRLNPGVKVAVAGQPPLEDVKYDPRLAALPPRAAAVALAVERDRAYARSRLELLEGAG